MALNLSKRETNMEQDNTPVKDIIQDLESESGRYKTIKHNVKVTNSVIFLNDKKNVNFKSQTSKHLSKIK